MRNPTVLPNPAARIGLPKRKERNGKEGRTMARRKNPLHNNEKVLALRKAGRKIK